MNLGGGKGLRNLLVGPTKNYRCVRLLEDLDKVSLQTQAFEVYGQ